MSVCNVRPLPTGGERRADDRNGSLRDKNVHVKGDALCAKVLYVHQGGDEVAAELVVH